MSDNDAFVRGNQSGDSDSESSSGSRRDGGQQKGKRKFSVSDDDDYNQGQEREEVVSKYIKALRQIRDYAKMIKGEQEGENRFSEIFEFYDKLNKYVLKNKNVVFEKGTPNCYLRIIKKLKSAVQDCPKAILEKSKKDKDGHQRLRKLITLKWKEYEQDLEKFVETQTTEEEVNTNKRKQKDSDSESEDNKKSDKDDKSSENEESSESEQNDSDSDTSSNNQDDTHKVDRTQLPKNERRKFWLKKDTETNEQKTIELTKEQIIELRNQLLAQTLDQLEEMIDEKDKIKFDSDIKRELSLYIEQKFYNYVKKRSDENEDNKKVTEWAKESKERFNQKIQKAIINNKSTEFQAPDVSEVGFSARMKKIILERTHESQLEKYYEDLQYYKQYFKEKKETQMEVILALLVIRLDYGRKINRSYLKSSLWNQNFQDLEQLFWYWLENKEIKLRNFKSEEQSPSGPFENKQEVLTIIGINVTRLDSELKKGFQNLDFNSKEYSDLITQLYQLLRLAKIVQDHLEKEKVNSEIIFNLAQMRLENLYCIPDELYLKLRNKQAGKDISNQCFEEHDSQKRITSLYNIILNDKRATNTEKIQATLFLIFHHSIHDRFEKARDLLLMSHAQEQIKALNLQSHFNRVLIQIGLAAFRTGKIKEANRYLQDIFSQNKTRVRELVQQNISRNYDQVEQTRRQALPYHQHINLDFAETVYHIVGMLIEIPDMVAEQQGYNNNKQNKYSKNTNFMQLYESFQHGPPKNQQNSNNLFQNNRHHLYNGPAESNLEFIYKASKSLKSGQWEKCYNSLMKIQTLRNENLQKQLLEQIKISALKTYMYLCKDVFTSVNLSNLESQFELTQLQVKNIVFKFVQKKKVMASIIVENDNNYLIFQDTIHSELQDKAIKTIDRIAAELQQNEELLDNKTGCYGSNKQEQNLLQEQQQQQNRNFRQFNTNKQTKYNNNWQNGGKKNVGKYQKRTRN